MQTSCHRWRARKLGFQMHKKQIFLFVMKTSPREANQHDCRHYVNDCYKTSHIFLLVSTARRSLLCVCVCVCSHMMFCAPFRSAKPASLLTHPPVAICTYNLPKVYLTSVKGRFSLYLQLGLGPSCPSGHLRLFEAAVSRPTHLSKLD